MRSGRRGAHVAPGRVREGVNGQAGRLAQHARPKGGHLSKALLGTVPVEVTNFNERHKVFVDKFSNITAALEAAFNRVLENSAPVDPAIFYLGRLCVEDFNEILVLCANGYGFGASKLIRGMFERVLTGLFLHFHPEQTEDFLDFYWISQRKEINNLKTTFGETAVDAATVKQVEEKFQEVRKRFEVTACEKCKTKRINHSWNKLDIVAMAKEVQTQSKVAMQRFVFEAYLRPLRYAHSTVASLLSRLKDEENVTFDHEFQRVEADIALKAAHRLLVLTVMLQAIHFNLEPLVEHWNKLVEDFAQIWGISEEAQDQAAAPQS